MLVVATLSRHPGASSQDSYGLKIDSPLFFSEAPDFGWFDGHPAIGLALSPDGGPCRHPRPCAHLTLLDFTQATLLLRQALESIQRALH